jgi:hyperosmotically inducible protein
MKNNLLVTALGVALTIGTAGIALAADNDTSGVSQDKSAQPGTDTWITTKVKAELMATKGIPSTDISVTTTNGLVTLSGVVDNKAQVQKSVAVAKSIKGVQTVDSSALSARN